MQLIKAFVFGAIAWSLTASALPKSRWRGKQYIKSPQCNCRNARMPEPAGGYTATYSKPEDGLRVSRVILGVGTQNYTCGGAPSDAPVPNGARASLYDASCLAALEPSLLHYLPKALLAGTSGQLRVLDIVLSMAAAVGVHSFPNDAKTPVFYFNNDNGHIFVGQKKGDVPAPATDQAGEYGTVPWLNLDAKKETKGFKRAYRVVTAGGKPPPTCEGRAAQFEMPYVAEYWFWS